MKSPKYSNKKNEHFAKGEKKYLLKKREKMFDSLDDFLDSLEFLWDNYMNNLDNCRRMEKELEKKNR